MQRRPLLERHLATGGRIARPCRKADCQEAHRVTHGRVVCLDLDALDPDTAAWVEQIGHSTGHIGETE